MRDYEELVKALRDEDNCNVLDYIDEAADAIEELSKPKWISVTERLPEENGRYLVRYKRDIVLDYTEVHDDEVRIMRFFVGTGWRYPFLCQPELRAAEQQTVTHWMPLPSAPEEVTQDD